MTFLAWNYHCQVVWVWKTKSLFLGQAKLSLTAINRISNNHAWKNPQNLGRTKDRMTISIYPHWLKLPASHPSMILKFISSCISCTSIQHVQSQKTRNSHLTDLTIVPISGSSSFGAKNDRGDQPLRPGFVPSWVDLATVFWLGAFSSRCATDMIFTITAET